MTCLAYVSIVGNIRSHRNVSESVLARELGGKLLSPHPTSVPIPNQLCVRVHVPADVAMKVT